MRKSIEDIKHMVGNIPYVTELPTELKPYHVYLTDTGHSILCVLKTHLEKAKQSNMDDYEVLVPVKYVLEKGYDIFNDYIIVDAEYSSELGLLVDGKYSEY